METLGREEFKNINSYFSNDKSNKNIKNEEEEDMANSKTPEKLLKKLEKNVMFSKN